MKMILPTLRGRIFETELAPTSRIQYALIRDGYARTEPEFIADDSGDLAKARTSFLRTIRKNPLDGHCANGNRYRRYGVFILHPWSGMLESIPPVWDADQNERVARYLQSARINPEHGGKARAFAPLTTTQRTNLFLRSTIMRCFRSIPWSDLSQPVIVGVHVIQLIAHRDAPAVSSPDALHRDGEPWTWAFLLDRRGVIGGENTIAMPDAANKHPSEVSDRDIIDRFTLRKPFEGWVVDDRKVSHYVSPVSVDSKHVTGWRTILLIDFTPAVPDIER